MCRKRARSPIYYLPQVHGEPCIGRGIRGSEKELRGEVEELPGGVETGRSSEARKKVRLERECVCGRVEDGVTERVNVATREHIEAAKREQVGVRDVHRAMEYERGVSLHGSPALRGMNRLNMEPVGSRGGASIHPSEMKMRGERRPGLEPEEQSVPFEEVDRRGSNRVYGRSVRGDGADRNGGVGDKRKARGEVLRS